MSATYTNTIMIDLKCKNVYTYERVYDDRAFNSIIVFSTKTFSHVRTCFFLGHLRLIRMPNYLQIHFPGRDHLMGVFLGGSQKQYWSPRSRSYFVVPLPWAPLGGCTCGRHAKWRTIFGCRCNQQIYYWATKSDRLAGCSLPEIVWCCGQQGRGSAKLYCHQRETTVSLICNDTS